MDAGFISVVDIRQYFMTKDTGDLTQFHAVAYREYTLPRNDGSSQPKGWIQGNTKIGPVLEVTTSCLYGKHGVEIIMWWPGTWCFQGMSITGGGGLVRVPNLRVCEHLFDVGVAHAGGEKDELTSCRGAV